MITIDPDTVEGDAILGLYRLIKDVEQSDGAWPGADVVNQLDYWFTTLGIHVGDDPENVAKNLRDRFATLRRAAHRPDVEFRVHVRARRPAAHQYARTCASALVTALGPNSSAVVVDAAGDQVAQFAPIPASSGPR